MSFLAMIAAVGSNRVIGKDNDLLWHLPKDFAFFKKATEQRVVVMGRNTYESMGKALPHRYNFVVSSNPNFKPNDARVFDTPEKALAEAKVLDETPFIIGGQGLYTHFLPQATHLMVTHVQYEAEGHAYFPEYDQKDYITLFTKEYPADTKHKYAFTIKVYQKTGYEPTAVESAFLDQQIGSLLAE